MRRRGARSARAGRGSAIACSRLAYVTATLPEGPRIATVSGDKTRRRKRRRATRAGPTKVRACAQPGRPAAVPSPHGRQGGGPRRGALQLAGQAARQADGAVEQPRAPVAAPAPAAVAPAAPAAPVAAPPRPPGAPGVEGGEGVDPGAVVPPASTPCGCRVGPGRGAAVVRASAVAVARGEAGPRPQGDARAGWARCLGPRRAAAGRGANGPRSAAAL